MSKLRDQVAEFHRAFNLPTRDRPEIPKDVVEIRYRAALILEETIELLESLFGSLPDFDMAKEIIGNAMNQREPRVDLAAFADACADLDYVVEGGRLAFGIDGGPIADEVHRCNMLKVGGERREDGKVLKPKTWEAPKIEEELARQAGEPHD